MNLTARVGRTTAMWISFHIQCMAPVLGIWRMSKSNLTNWDPCLAHTETTAVSLQVTWIIFTFGECAVRVPFWTHCQFNSATHSGKPICAAPHLSRVSASSYRNIIHTRLSISFSTDTSTSVSCVTVLLAVFFLSYISPFCYVGTTNLQRLYPCLSSHKTMQIPSHSARCELPCPVSKFHKLHTESLMWLQFWSCCFPFALVFCVLLFLSMIDGSVTPRPVHSHWLVPGSDVGGCFSEMNRVSVSSLSQRLLPGKDVDCNTASVLGEGPQLHLHQGKTVRQRVLSVEGCYIYCICCQEKPPRYCRCHRGKLLRLTLARMDGNVIDGNVTFTSSHQPRLEDYLNKRERTLRLKKKQ